MAFISSFCPPLQTKPFVSLPSSHHRHTIRASSNSFEDKDNLNSSFPFEPFDGSTPLLPPWRPPTLESDFSYNAQRIVSRESQAEQKKIVQVKSPGYGTLIAELIQEIEAKEGTKQKFWLRPLLLDGEKEGFMDLRGGSDVFWEGGSVEEVAGEKRVRVEINLAATEGDVIGRVVRDDDWRESTSLALLTFMKTFKQQ